MLWRIPFLLASITSRIACTIRSIAAHDSTGTREES